MPEVTITVIPKLNSATVDEMHISGIVVTLMPSGRETPPFLGEPQDFDLGTAQGEDNFMTIKIKDESGGNIPLGGVFKAGFSSIVDDSYNYTFSKTIDEWTIALPITAASREKTVRAPNGPSELPKTNVSIGDDGPGEL